MIVNLLTLIEENTDHIYEDGYHFRDYLINKGIFERLSFYQALEEFEVFCMEERLDVGNCMPSIQELYDPESAGIEQTTQGKTNEFFKDQNNNRF